ncbi:uncharacterized protein [Euwallacea fornicatus]|uniref:uncharacterized protein isoform X2 n=1 Tax=Euwallacea fornicatus TaxID=995702 RepID=UPI00338EE566
MLERHVFVLALLLCLAACEWIEITHFNKKEELSTSPSLESTIRKPPEILYDNSTQKYVIIDDKYKVIDEEEMTIDTVGDDVEEDDNEGEEDDELEEKVTEPSGLMLLVKHVQTQLMNFKGRSLHDKTQHLVNLSDAILNEIKERVTQLFKPSTNRNNQESRVYKDFEDNHVGYPSNEGALMTIGFLTFAVFLIKLVLKLIYALKLKQQYYYNQTTTPASIFLKHDGRNVQDFQFERYAKIMQRLEEYKVD